MRSGLCLPLAPTTSSTSASSSSHSTPSPTPTLIASSPSFAALASSPSALCTAGGSPSMPCGLAATDAADTVLMAVGPPVLVDLFALATVPTGPDEAGGPPPTKFYELRDNLRQKPEAVAQRGIMEAVSDPAGFEHLSDDDRRAFAEVRDDPRLARARGSMI